MSQDSITDDLREIRDLLGLYGYHGQAAIVEEVLLHAGTDEDRPRFVELLSRGDMWGSSGSVFDVDLGVAGTEQSLIDRQRFRGHLLRLAKYLVDAGDPEGTAAGVVEILETWQRM